MGVTFTHQKRVKDAHEANEDAYDLNVNAGRLIEGQRWDVDDNWKPENLQ